MPYLVDGSNLGGRLAGAAGARDRAAVLRLLLPLARRRRRIVVVFDGPDDAALAHAYGPLEVRFSGARTADAVILGLLRNRPRDCWVASDDRELLSSARDRGARTMSIDELLAPLAGPAKPAGARVETGKPGEERPVDVAEWEEWFRRGGGGRPRG